MPAVMTETKGLEQASREFKMPPVQVNDLVSLFTNADTNAGFTPALVIRVDGRSVRLMTLGQDCLGWCKETGVRHISDPELELRPAMKMNDGAWDYSPRHKETMKQIDQLEKRLSDVELKFSKKLPA